MGRRAVEIVLKSAESLTRQYPNSRMVVQAKANITNDSAPVKNTKADTVGDVNPTWNHHLQFTVRCSHRGTKSREFLNINLCNIMPDGSSCVIGSSQIPLVELLASASKEAMGSANYSCTVSTGGQLHLSYRLGAYVSRIRKIGVSIGLLTAAATVEGVVNYGINQVPGPFTGAGDGDGDGEEEDSNNEEDNSE